MMVLAVAVAGGIGLRFLAGGPSVEAERVRHDLSAIPPGATRSLGWDGRAVIVLHRRPETVAALGDRIAGDPTPDWFVAFDRGTARGCSVVWEASADRFREVCADAAWDAAGRPLKGHSPLAVPPHRITTDEVLIVGSD